MSSGGVNGQSTASEGESLAQRVMRIVQSARVVDMHTHLFPPSFGDLNLWGIDEVLTYHYLVAEYFRSSDVAYDEFWSLPKPRQAEVIWDTLFVRQSPLSEATAGVVGVLSALGLDPRASDLREARAYFAARDPYEHVSHVLDLAGVDEVVMTNDPLDPAESPFWADGAERDHRFHAALRIDPILNDIDAASPRLAAQGYSVDSRLTGSSISELRRFLDDWIARMRPLYAAVSLPPDFRFPDSTGTRRRVLDEALLPACRAHGLPMALMIGVRRQVNRALRLAGDGVGHSNVSAVERLCAHFPDNKFMVTYLARENQHALMVAARKFRNLLPFGCWWFVNNGSMVQEITRGRLEMLGASFVPQHSDARVLEQLIYKWRHSRRNIAAALTDSYAQLEANGRPATDAEIAADADRLLSGEFRRWTAASAGAQAHAGSLS